jgi:hypothetical protein
MATRPDAEQNASPWTRGEGDAPLGSTHKWAITFSVMLVTVMQVLDTSITNVAKPFSAEQPIRADRLRRPLNRALGPKVGHLTGGCNEDTFTCRSGKYRVHVSACARHQGGGR